MSTSKLDVAIAEAHIEKEAKVVVVGSNTLEARSAGMAGALAVLTAGMGGMDWPYYMNGYDPRPRTLYRRPETPQTPQSKADQQRRISAAEAKRERKRLLNIKHRK